MHPCMISCSICHYGLQFATIRNGTKSPTLNLEIMGSFAPSFRSFNRPIDGYQNSLPFRRQSTGEAADEIRSLPRAVQLSEYDIARPLLRHAVPTIRHLALAGFCYPTRPMLQSGDSPKRWAIRMSEAAISVMTSLSGADHHFRSNAISDIRNRPELVRKRGLVVGGYPPN